MWNDQVQKFYIDLGILSREMWDTKKKWEFEESEKELSRQNMVNIWKWKWFY